MKEMTLDEVFEVCKSDSKDIEEMLACFIEISRILARAFWIDMRHSEKTREKQVEELREKIPSGSSMHDLLAALWLDIPTALFPLIENEEHRKIAEQYYETYTEGGCAAILAFVLGAIIEEKARRANFESKTESDYSADEILTLLEDILESVPLTDDEQGMIAQLWDTVQNKGAL